MTERHPSRNREFSPVGELHQGKYCHPKTVNMIINMYKINHFTASEITEKIKFIGEFPNKTKTIQSIIYRNGGSSKQGSKEHSLKSKLSKNKNFRKLAQLHGMENAVDIQSYQEKQVENLRKNQEKVISKLRQDILKDDSKTRNQKILALKRTRMKLWEISDIYNISGERVRQICNQEIRKENGPKLSYNPL